MTGYVRPGTIAAALQARLEHPDWPLLCGGTDLMVNAGQRPGPAGVIDLWAMPEMCGIVEARGALHIGAATPWLEVVESPLIAARAPILAAAAREIGALQIQARGTIGGNLGTSSPVGDSLPVLLALDAELELRSPRGTRVVPYAGFCTGYRKTVMAPDELIAAVFIPEQPAPPARQLWRKVGTRRAQSISKVMAAAVLWVDAGKFRHVRIGLGAVADRPIRAVGVEMALLDRAPGPATAEAAATALAHDLRTISDVRSTAAYRLDTIQHVVRRFVLTMV